MKIYEKATINLKCHSLNYIFTYLTNYMLFMYILLFFFIISICVDNFNIEQHKVINI